MWIGFKKGHPRSEDGKFATGANDSGIDHRGDGYLELENMMNSGQHVAPGVTLPFGRRIASVRVGTAV
jgi:hypothetical protein